jgi:homoserine kinase
MDDRLHEPYRLKLIPGAAEAIIEARGKGVAAALSGAGPSILTFNPQNGENVVLAIQKMFYQKNIKTSVIRLSTINRGAWVK